MLLQRTILLHAELIRTLQAYLLKSTFSCKNRALLSVDTKLCMTSVNYVKNGYDIQFGVHLRK